MIRAGPSWIDYQQLHAQLIRIEEPYLIAPVLSYELASGEAFEDTVQFHRLLLSSAIFSTAHTETKL